MNKSALSRTVGGRKPLLVMAPYWQPVIDCLKQETSLTSVDAAPTAVSRRTMQAVSLVSSVDEVAELLSKSL